MIGTAASTGVRWSWNPGMGKSSPRARELGAFVGEIQGILEAYPQVLGSLFFAVAGLYGPHEFSRHAPMPQALGGGGTDFNGLFQWVADQGSNEATPRRNYLAEGHGFLPALVPEAPALWGMSSEDPVSSGSSSGAVARMAG